MSRSLKKGNLKLNELKEKYSDLNFEMTMPGGFGGTYDQFEDFTYQTSEKLKDGSSPM
jgi:hypothetical protein